MKVEKLEVTKLKISKIQNLDPVHVFLEDIEKGKGRITIVCFGKSWTFYFGGLGDRTISEFIIEANNSYLAGKVDNLESEIPDSHQIQMDAQAAGEWGHDNSHHDLALMSKLYGDYCPEIPMIQNPEYIYFCRIINTVRSALEGFKG